VGFAATGGGSDCTGCLDTCVKVGLSDLISGFRGLAGIGDGVRVLAGRGEAVRGGPGGRLEADVADLLPGG
jgi:hypothetical protein